MVKLFVLLATIAATLAFAASEHATPFRGNLLRADELLLVDASAGKSDCAVTPYGKWSECDPVTHSQSRTRAVATQPTNNGKACPALRENKFCVAGPEQGPKDASAIPLGGLALVVIDQQVDFHPGGSLAIPTANDDADRIAAFIETHLDEISQLVFTLDSHQRYHIAHGIFWTDSFGNMPTPFTAITTQDILDGKWSPRDATLLDYVVAYTTALEASHKFVLTIWPEHCLMGSQGHNIVPNVLAAALKWANKKKTGIQYVFKGTNSFTEHYSALRAEYELSFDPATKLNQALIDNLAKASKVVVVGEALSHCVNYSVRDLVANWPEARRKDLYVFTDCSSVVPGFEAAGDAFVADMAAAGLNLIKSTEF